MRQIEPAEVERWQAAWPEALALWGRALRLQDPVLLTHRPRTRPDVLAWFDLAAMDVTVNLRQVGSLGLLDRPETPLVVLGHEIGHHVLAPSDRTTNAKVVARCAAGLVDRPELAGFFANLWCDTLINDRLHRTRGLDMAAVYRASGVATEPVMRVWMRGFELLWRLPTGSLCGPDLGAEMDADGLLLSRHARAFARDAVGGAAGFAALLRRWLPESGGAPSAPRWCAHEDSGHDDPLDGLAGDDSLAAPVVHPAMDPAVNPEAPVTRDDAPAEAGAAAAAGGGGQGFGPARLADVYGSVGSTRDAGVDWYVARAQPHLIPFPTTERPVGIEEEPQGWEDWGVGDDLADVDWLASVTRSPVVVPGRTTVQRVVDREPLTTPTTLPLDLDLYVDSSGSMPDPRATPSPSVLAGVVLALSALRAGARVQVTVWASPQQVARTVEGFTRDRDAIVRTLLHYWAGGTTFPLRDLARDHPPRTTPRPPWESDTHIAVISDWGVVSMFGQWGQPEELADVAASALVSAGGGGSLVLRETEVVCDRVREVAGDYVTYAVPLEQDLVPFAARFARERWGRSAVDAGGAPRSAAGRMGW